MGGWPKGECVVTDEGNGVLEIKNIAVLAEYRRKGYGRILIDFIISRYGEKIYNAAGRNRRQPHDCTFLCRSAGS